MTGPTLLPASFSPVVRALAACIALCCVAPAMAQNGKTEMLWVDPGLKGDS